MSPTYPMVETCEFQCHAVIVHVNDYYHTIVGLPVALSDDLLDLLSGSTNPTVCPGSGDTTSLSRGVDELNSCVSSVAISWEAGHA